MNRPHDPHRSAAPLWAAALCTGLPALARAASEGGLVLVPRLDLLGALLLLFVLLVIPVNQLLFAPLLRVLDEREDRIGGTRRKAERLEREAATVLERYQGSVREVREEAELARRALLEEVRADVQRETAAARRDAESRIESARAELAGSLDEARASLRAQATQLAREAASRVLGRAL